VLGFRTAACSSYSHQSRTGGEAATGLTSVRRLPPDSRSFSSRTHPNSTSRHQPLPTRCSSGATSWAAALTDHPVLRAGADQHISRRRLNQAAPARRTRSGRPGRELTDRSHRTCSISPKRASNRLTAAARVAGSQRMLLLSPQDQTSQDLTARISEQVDQPRPQITGNEGTPPLPQLFLRPGTRAGR